MSTTSRGKHAEELVAKHLQSDGHTVVEVNWRTRWCEIDIVSTKDGVVYFTEVKYRGSSSWGDGLEYITKKKLRQMRFAAEFWLHNHKWKGESQLLAASVDSMDDIEIVEV